MSGQIGLFYGSTTGKTETVAETIRDVFGGGIIDLHDVSKASVEDFDDYTYLIIGSPTWNIGELQSDWEGFFPELDEVDFTGKKIAYFGVGDQIGYPDNFLDAMGMLAEKITERGGETVGNWSTTGYDFSESKGVADGNFIGLALDEDNQSDLTDERIKAWVPKIKQAFGL